MNNLTWIHANISEKTRPPFCLWNPNERNGKEAGNICSGGETIVI